MAITIHKINSWDRTDSIIYLKSGKMSFSYINGQPDQLIEYKYNDKGQMIFKRVCSMSDTNANKGSILIIITKLVY